MTDSFRRIDYSIRPAKHAERRMLSDIFRRLSSFDQIEEYRYVGFGSVWFSDFLLFHRSLGIKHMLSIEQAVHSRKRFEFNRPFNFDIDFRSSTAVLPELSYERRQCIWLDYDDPISTEMLSDAASIATRARSGSVLAISIQCHRAPDIAESDLERSTDDSAALPEERFRERFEGYNVKDNITRSDLGGWPFGKLSRDLLLEAIQVALRKRRLANPEDGVDLHTICEFEYEDGAKMTTLVVLFCAPEESEMFDSCKFDELEFLDGANPIYIPTPKLTVKEFRHLESQLPLADNEMLNTGDIPPSEAKGFARMYRYFPNFAVVEN